jgi:hypothetical protein
MELDYDEINEFLLEYSELKDAGVEFEYAKTPQTMSTETKGQNLFKTIDEQKPLPLQKTDNMETTTMTDKEITSIALQDVISLDKYKNLDLGEAKVLWDLKVKDLSDDNWQFAEPLTLKEAIYKSLDDKGYIAINEDSTSQEDYYILSDSTNGFIEAVKNRIITLKNINFGMDLFPNDANITDNEPEKVYADIKSCLISEGDMEDIYLFEGKEFINSKSEHNEKWRIVSFYKYGATVEHIPTNRLMDKKKNRKLSFKEMKNLFEDGDVTIEGIDNITQLNHCLKIITKCIDAIDSNEALENERKEHSISKTKLSVAEKKIKDEATANKLISINSDAWEKLGIGSGGQIYDSIEVQKKYKAFMDNAIKYIELPLNNDVYKILEDENEHSLNQYLTLSGAYGEKERQDWLKYAENVKWKDTLMNPIVFDEKALAQMEAEEKRTSEPAYIVERLKKNIPSLEKMVKHLKGADKTNAENKLKAWKAQLKVFEKKIMRDGGAVSQIEELTY